MKTLSPAFEAHSAKQVTTDCFLLKIGPLPDDTYICLTSLNRNEIYDDGDGAKTYYASTGTEISNLSAELDLLVNNGEAKTLMQKYPGQGVSIDMVDAGFLDSVNFHIYKINYRDHSQGHEIMASGPIGEVKKHRGGLITLELRSWSQYLQQNNVIELDSLTCRVKYFGSQPGDERFPCMLDISGFWVNSVVVTSIGSESVRTFAASSLLQPDAYFEPGLVRWDSGDNVLSHQKVESFSPGGVIVLRFAARKPIQVGDIFSIRRDCTRGWSGANSCETYNNRQWYRGEPKIPMSNAIALSVPFSST